MKSVGNNEPCNLACAGNDHRLFFLALIDVVLIDDDAQLKQAQQNMRVTQYYYCAVGIRDEILKLNGYEFQLLFQAVNNGSKIGSNKTCPAYQPPINIRLGKDLSTICSLYTAAI